MLSVHKSTYAERIPSWDCERGRPAELAWKTQRVLCSMLAAAENAQTQADGRRELKGISYMWDQSGREKSTQPRSPSGKKKRKGVQTELPLLPLHWYLSKNVIQTRVKLRVHGTHRLHSHHHQTVCGFVNALRSVKLGGLLIMETVQVTGCQPRKNTSGNLHKRSIYKANFWYKSSSSS